MIRRPPTLAGNGMIAASHPLAVQAGAAMLQAGGHAVDAVIAAGAVLSVVEPAASGIGGDAFFLIYDHADGAVAAINGNGAAPAALTRDKFSGLSSPPLDGPLSATVPGCVDAWHEAWYGWGRLEWRKLLQPAIWLAQEGFPVSWQLARVLRRERRRLARDPGLSALYLHPDGTPLEAGEICRPHALGSVLSGIARHGSASFYKGQVVRRLCKAVRDAGGVLAAEDFEAYESRLLPPYEQEIGGHTICQQPLPTQGVFHLLMLSLAEWAAGRQKEGAPEELHRQIESARIALYLRDLLVSDTSSLPVQEHVLVEALLAPSTVERLGRLLLQEPLDPVLAGAVIQGAAEDPQCALAPVLKEYRSVLGPGFGAAAPVQGGDTTYLCAADRFGNMAGLIQSVFHAFGCGFLDPQTGILLNNRASAFSLDPSHVNCLEPGKRTLHTLNSYMVLRDGLPWLVGGTPGADHQIQTNLQVLRHIMAGRILWPGPRPMKEEKWTQARTPEEPRTRPDAPELLASALEAPRWGLRPDGRVEMESRMPAAVRDRLNRMGHQVVRIGPWDGSGRVQAIQVLERGVFCGTTDPRGEGCVAGL